MKEDTFRYSRRPSGYTGTSNGAVSQLMKALMNDLKTGLEELGLDTGVTQSAIIPVKIGDINLNARICGMLLEAGVYANQINYPAVAKKDAVTYLVSRGIAEDRMIAEGYGETRLVNDCGNGVRCSREKHQANRRTEVTVLEY